MEPKFWIFIGAATGMPLAVEKCSFAPTIHPGNGAWVEFAAKDDRPDTHAPGCQTKDGYNDSWCDCKPAPAEGDNHGA